MIDFLKNIFSSEEDVELSYKDAEKFYKAERSNALEEAREKETELVEKTSDILEEISSEIKQFEGYEDHQNIQAVEDVAENFFHSRKKLLEEFEPSEEIEQHAEDLEQFLSEFEDLSRKENAVMQRVKKDFNSLFKTIENLNNHLEDIEQFLEEEYSSIYELEDLKQIIEDIVHFNQEISDLETKLEDKSIEQLEKKIEAKEKEIDALKNSDKWQNKGYIEDRITETQNERDSLVKNLSKNVSKIDRGIKKLIYSIENGQAEFEEDIEELKKLRKKEFDSIKNPETLIEEVAKVVEEEDLLDNTQKKKFEDAVEKFESLDRDLDKIDRLEREEEELKNQYENLDILEELENVEKELDKLKEKREKRLEEISSIKEEIEQLRSSKSDSLKELESLLDSSLKDNITVVEAEKESQKPE